MKRVKKTKAQWWPVEISYPDDVEEHEPTLRLRNTTPQSSDQVGLPAPASPKITWPIGLSVGFFVRERKSSMILIDEGLMQLIDLKDGVRPDALEVMGPVEVDGTNLPGEPDLFGYPQDVHGFAFEAEPRIPDRRRQISWGLFIPESAAPSSRCIRSSASSSVARSIWFSFSRRSVSSARVSSRPPVTSR